MEHTGSNKRVLVIGSAGLDIIARPQLAIEEGVSHPAYVRTSFGGVSRNIAENLARLGVPVSLITVVGRDDFGRKLLEHARDLGIDTHAIIQTDKFNTACYLAIVGREGKLQYGLDDMRALTLLSSEHLKEHQPLFEQAELIFVDANLSPVALRTVFSLARQAGVRVCADTTSSTLAKRLVPFLPRMHMLTANRLEATVLCEEKECVTNQQSALQAARYLISRGVEAVIIPLGAAGVCYATSDISGHIPAIRTQVLDPTGAGDALTAAVIFGMLNEMTLDEAIRLGVSAASLTLRHPGTVFTELSLERLYDELIV